MSQRVLGIISLYLSYIASTIQIQKGILNHCFELYTNEHVSVDVMLYNIFVIF